MKREIKFRGKGKEGWRYGSLLQGVGFFVSIVSADEISNTPIDELGAKAVRGSVEPGTVGQFTGIKDKNGTDIYEGDIVTAWSQGSRMTGEIRWRPDGMWIIYPAWQNGEFWWLHIDNREGGQDSGVEIIGNIYDNPELRKDE